MPLHGVTVFCLTFDVGESAGEGKVPGDHNPTVLLPIQSVP